MSAIVTFSSIKMVNDKNIKYRPDKDGYYIITLGALNTYNNKGDFYDGTDEVKQVFADSSEFQEKIKKGQLYSEWGHPKPLPTDNLQSFLRRVKRIEESKVCAHIRKVWLEESNDGVIYIKGEVKPYGPYADTLKDGFATDDINVAFSIRSITRDRIVNGVNHKSITKVITFDCVLSQGIASANKWSSVGLEADDMLVMDLENPDVVKEILSMEIEEVSMEDDSVVCDLESCLQKYVSTNKVKDIVKAW